MARAKPIRDLDPDAPVLVTSARVIELRLDEMLDYECYIGDPDEVYQLHQMRIAAKRLRYSLEIFLDVYNEATPFGKDYGKAIEAIKSLQEFLGDIHDADVLLPQLAEHLGRLLRPAYGTDRRGDDVVGVHNVDMNACQGLMTLCQETRQRRDERYALLLAEWKRLQDEHFFFRFRQLLDEAALLP